jgi:hypothetical protein
VCHSTAICFDFAGLAGKPVPPAQQTNNPTALAAAMTKAATMVAGVKTKAPPEEA